MSGADTALALLLRKCEWMLGDAAYAVGGGRLSSTDREVLSEALDELAETLRPWTDQPLPQSSS